MSEKGDMRVGWMGKKREEKRKEEGRGGYLCPPRTAKENRLCDVSPQTRAASTEVIGRSDSDDGT